MPSLTSPPEYDKGKQFTPRQWHVLEEEFQKTPYPNYYQREILAFGLHTSVNRVTVRMSGHLQCDQSQV